MHAAENLRGYDTDFRNPFKVLILYVDMSLLNQGVQEGKRQSVWKGYWLCRAELHREELPHLPVSLPPGS